MRRGWVGSPVVMPRSDRVGECGMQWATRVSMNLLTTGHLRAVVGKSARWQLAGGVGDLQPARFQIILRSEYRAQFTVQFPERLGISGPRNDLLLQFGLPAR